MTLKIDGMHCMGCALGIEEKLEELEYINNAKASVKDKNVNFDYDETKFDLREVKKVIHDIGFNVID